MGRKILIKHRWLPIFFLGACFGYGVALFIAPVGIRTEDILPEEQLVTASVQPLHQAIQTEPAAVRQPAEQKQRVQKVSSPRLEAAYIALIRESVARRAFTTAFDLLADAEQQLGISAPRLILLADIQRLRKNFRGARATLHQVLAFDPTVAEQAYPMLRQTVTALITLQDDALTFDEKVQMLSQEIIDDPSFATYYTLLGRLYYRHENYTDAITNLEYALQLDHTQGALLSPLIAAAKQRLEHPGLVEVPISSHGRALNVEVKLNDAQQRFHFMLDTGATHTAISIDTAQKLGIPLSADLPVIQVSTANGVVKVPVITLNAVNLQGAMVEQVPAVVLRELNEFDGLLGLSFLNHFNIDIKQDEGKLLLLKNPTNQ